MINIMVIYVNKNILAFSYYTTEDYSTRSSLAMKRFIFLATEG